MTEKFAGQSKEFVWFFGIVEDRNDPKKLGRVRVRAYNLHTDDKSLLPTDMLPWATPLQSITSAGTAEIGCSPTGLIEGSIAFGFMADGAEAQIPMVVGVLAGTPTVKGAETHDVAQRARGIDNLKNDYMKDVEPNMAFNSKYPYNKTFTSESDNGKGHLLEVDDTPNHERLLAWHKKGTYIEIDQDGRLVVKGVANSYYLTVGDGVVAVEGNLTVIVSSSAGVAIEGNCNIEIKGSLFANVGGVLVCNVASDATVNVGGQTLIKSVGDIKIESDSNINIEASNEVTIKGTKISLN